MTFGQRFAQSGDVLSSRRRERKYGPMLASMYPPKEPEKQPDWGMILL